MPNSSLKWEDVLFEDVENWCMFCYFNVMDSLNSFFNMGNLHLRWISKIFLNHYSEKLLWYKTSHSCLKVAYNCNGFQIRMIWIISSSSLYAAYITQILTNIIKNNFQDVRYWNYPFQVNDMRLLYILLLTTSYVT